jgi:hypothetical protein
MAEKKTAVLKGKELKAARKILDEKVGEFEDLLEARAAELSEQLNIPLREVKQRLGHVTRYTDGRDYNEFSAKVWKRMKEMNVGKDLLFSLFVEDADHATIGKQKGERIQMPEVQKIVQAEGTDAWSADDLVQLKKDYLAYQESKSKGTRPSNSSAAKDAGAVASNISKEVSFGFSCGTSGTVASMAAMADLYFRWIFFSTARGHGHLVSWPVGMRTTPFPQRFSATPPISSSFRRSTRSTRWFFW